MAISPTMLMKTQKQFDKDELQRICFDIDSQLIRNNKEIVNEYKSKAEAVLSLKLTPVQRAQISSKYLGVGWERIEIIDYDEYGSLVVLHYPTRVDQAYRHNVNV